MMFVQKFQGAKTLKPNKNQTNEWSQEKQGVCRRLHFLLKPVLGLNFNHKYLKYSVPLSQRWILIFCFLFSFYAVTPQYNDFL